MTTLYAQPYDISATGFYFESTVEYSEKAARNKNDFGGIVEEYEIQFIDGEELDCDLAQAICLSQANYPKFFELCENLDGHDKILFIIALGECGYDFDPDVTDPCSEYEIDLYEMGSMRELAEYFVDEGLMGEIPAPLARYFDYDAFARDLSIEYSEVRIAGNNYIYACG